MEPVSLGRRLSSLIWYPTEVQSLSSLSWATRSAIEMAEILLGWVHTILEYSVAS